MTKFAHLADCHLGGWKQEELQELNLASFQKAIEIIINEKLDFVLISGDLFDSAYPSIEILKQTFAEFRKLHDNQIPVFLIAGSHDFSASGKTFLDVLEKAGFCKNIEQIELQENGKMKLIPLIYKNTAIHGYSGKKSGMEIPDLEKIYFEPTHYFSILMLHTTINDIVGNFDMNSIAKENLPLADYYALGHIHQPFYIEEKNSHYIYPGPTFPNNFQELVDLKCGGFQITEINQNSTKTQNIKIPLKEIVFLEIEIDNALIATEFLIHEIDKLNLKDKIFLLKLKGTLKQGKSGDINYHEIDAFVKKKQAYSFLRNINHLKASETEIEIFSTASENIDTIEKKILGEYSKTNPNDFNKYLPQLIHALSIEKNEDEKINTFENRILLELKNILSLKEML